MKRALRVSAILAILLLLAALGAPFVRVDQYREQIRAGLQRALQRKVDIYGDTRLNLFRGPGFSIEKVVIHEDPAIGIEPVASVPELQTTVSLSSLWTGRLEFSTVRFVEPSLNFAKPETGTWNLVPLLAGAVAQSAQGGRFPEIQVADGRIDFKLGDTKSAFYLTDTDLTITPRRDGFDIRFSGAPARTDRAAGGYGFFSGSGRIRNGQIDMDVELEKSPVEDFMTLARGATLGLHGLVASKAKVTGPVGKPSITGRLVAEDVHRWDLMQAHGASWSLNYRGQFDLAGQRFEVQAEPKDNPGTPVSIRLVVSQLLSRPDWRAEIGVDKMAAAALMEIARHLGTPLPDGLVVEGDAAGTLAYGSGSGMQGQIAIENAAVTLKDGPQFRMPLASLLITGDEIQLKPAALEGKEHTAQLEGTYAPFRHALTARLTGRGMSLDDLRNQGILLPLAERFKGGIWSGSVGYADEKWQAKIVLRGATTQVPGIADPVVVNTARIEVDGERLSVRQAHCRAGQIEAFGHYSYEPESDRPHRFDFALPTADAAELERLLKPTLQRQSGFIARTLRLRAQTPDWLRERRADGRIRIGLLTVGDEELRGVHARILWSGTTVRLTKVEAKLAETALSGSAIADLRDAEPKYRLEGSVKRMPWKNGAVDMDGTLETSGTGVALVSRLRAEGRFEARALSFAPETAVGAASGSFGLAVSRTGPQWKLTGLEAAMGTERFNGEGGTQPDGRLAVELQSPLRNVSLKLDVAGVPR